MNTKLLVVFVSLLLFSCSSVESYKQDRSLASKVTFDKEDVANSIRQTSLYMKERQLEDHSFSGAFVSDVTQEAIFLSLAKLLDREDLEIKNEMIETLLKRIEPNKLGWHSYPGGGVDHSVTGFTLRSLEYVGVDLNNSDFKAAFTNYIKNGGDKKLNITIRLQMGLLGLLPAKDSIPPVPKEFLNLNYKVGMKKLGIHGLLLYPLLGTKILKEFADNSLKEESLSENDFRNLKVTLGEEGQNTKFYTKRSKIDLVKQTIAFALQKRGRTNAWYGGLFSSAYVVLLHEAERTGLGNFQKDINDVMLAFKGWINKSEEGFYVVNPSKSDVWDTAATVNALNSLSDDFNDVKERLNRNKATSWMLDKTIYFNDSRKSAVWSFDSTDLMLPDLDDTAAVAHALATSEFKNTPEVTDKLKTTLPWILERQNKDGGFPAWNRGVSGSLFGFLETFAKLPKMADVSQSDVTARILHMIHKVGPLNVIDQKNLTAVKKRACDYFVKEAETIPNIKPKTFTGHWVSNYTYATTHVIIGLINGDCENKDGWNKELIEWLVSVQNQDGGFGEDNSSYINHKFVASHSTLSQTNLTMFGLIEAYEYYKEKDKTLAAKLHKSISSGVNYLLNRTNNGTTFFEPEFTAIMVKGQIYSRYELLTAYSSLYVLGRWHELM